MSTTLPVVFDGHNDTILSLLRTGRSFFDESDEGHVDLPRARRGGLGGGFFAVYIIDQAIMQARLDAQARAHAAEQRIDQPRGERRQLRRDAIAQPAQRHGPHLSTD